MDYKILKVRFLSSFFIVTFFTSYLFFLNDKINYLVNFVYLLIIFELFMNFKRNRMFIVILIYILLSLLSVNIYFNYYYNFNKFILFFSILVFFDTFSYIFGSLFGKKKIFESISKNKTYVGFIFGCIFSFIFSGLINYYFQIINNFDFVIFCLPLILFGFIGDLIESFFKIKSNLKDSSNFIPGHGGFFDRFDSFILSIYYLLIFSIYF